jgi:excisionase family DNA binding protein
MANETQASERLLRREELAKALRVSLRTVDEMVAKGEIPLFRIRGAVRFYLPDVVRALTATALTSKRGCSRKLQAPNFTVQGSSNLQTSKLRNCLGEVAR